MTYPSPNSREEEGEKQLQKQNQSASRSSGLNEETSKELLTMTKTKTLADIFGSASLGAENIVVLFSGFRFDTSYLEHYAHKEELRAAGNEALNEFSMHPFRGNETLAKLMARTMEILHKQRSFKVPGNWVVLLREIRESAKNESAEDYRKVGERISDYLLLESLLAPGCALGVLPGGADYRELVRDLFVQDRKFHSVIHAATRELGPPGTWPELKHWANKCIELGLRGNHLKLVSEILECVRNY